MPCSSKPCVATLAQAASAAYYLESQRSFRHPNEYYTAGEEPDGVWFSAGGCRHPKSKFTTPGLFGLSDGGKVATTVIIQLHSGQVVSLSGNVVTKLASW